ncbi:hypothetical protein D9M72_595550 [compost metagenome]
MGFSVGKPLVEPAEPAAATGFEGLATARTPLAVKASTEARSVILCAPSAGDLLSQPWIELTISRIICSESPSLVSRIIPASIFFAKPLDVRLAEPTYAVYVESLLLAT